MSYSIKTSDGGTTIVVEDQSLNTTSTSLSLIGKNFVGFSQYIAEDFLHLLENFANSTEPANKLKGQLWLDTSNGLSQLKIYDGSNWLQVSGINRGTSTPTFGTPGDLWFDTTKNQLNVYNGTTWVLVGPMYSTGLLTGPNVEVLVDVNNINHSVISLYSEGYRIAIISNASFVPKTTIVGFAQVKYGITLNSINIDMNGNPSLLRLWGSASQADALNVTGSDTPIPASNFLRSDISSTVNYSFNVKTDDGLSIGQNLEFNIGRISSQNATVLTSKTNNNDLKFILNNSGTLASVMQIMHTGQVGIGLNKTPSDAILDITVIDSITNPATALLGIKTDGIVKITDTTDTSGVGGLDSASLWTDGGLSVVKNSTFGGSLDVYNTIYVNNLTLLGAPVDSAVVLIPGSDAASGLYEIGSSSRTFKNIYSNTFTGNVSGDVTGNVTGNVTGSSAKIATRTRFEIVGDIETAPIYSDGQTARDGLGNVITVGSDSAVKLTATIGGGFFTDPARPPTTSVYDTDYLMIYRGGLGAGVKSISRKNFLSTIATVPAGAIMPFAGTTVPTGYLLCDGSEVSQTTYATLFSVIGLTYNASPTTGMFALPDLRGRFALGLDNMTNGSPASANRVTATEASNLGQGSGTEKVTLAAENIPDHTHNLQSANGNQFFAVGPSGLTDADPAVMAAAGSEPSTAFTGPALTNSGALSTSPNGQAFSVMNPFLAINYIIYTGQ